MSIPRVVPLGVFALMLWLPTVRAEVAVRFAPEIASLFRYEPFTLRLEVESEAPPETPELPAVPDLTVTSVRRLPSDPVRQVHTFRIGMIAERDGILTVPPFAVQAGQQTVLTSALRLRIGAPRPAKEMSLAIKVEPTALRVGQVANVTVTWTSELPFSRCKQLLFEIPLLADERCQLFPLDPTVPEAQRIGLPVNNIRLFAEPKSLVEGGQSLTLRFKLVPREPCVLRTEPARIVCALVNGQQASGNPPSYFYNHFFEGTSSDEVFEQIYLTAPMPEITVTALAESGRTAYFADVVGQCNLRTSVQPTQLVVGQGALLTVHLDNLDFARHITGLPSAAFDALRTQFQLSREPIRETVTDNARSFTRVLRPLRPGIARVPAIVVQTFDPETGQYKTLRSEPIPVTVEPDPEHASRVFASRVDAQTPIPLPGIRHNRAGNPALISLRDLLELLGRYWWVFVTLPPMLWLTLLPMVRRLERCRRDPIYARAMAAWWRFRRTVRRDEEAAWRHYLADRLGLYAEALTADTVTEALRARDVDAKLVAEARRRFEERDAADYGKRPAAPRQVTRSLVRRLQKATVPMLLFCSLLVPLPVNAAQSAEGIFASAIRLHGEKPDEAQPLFVDAALRFESAEQFANAGNSWYFAGENGRALANYRAAERRWPFDRQLRDSIEFLRAGRADAFPAPSTPTGTLSALWGRFCAWAPVLRVGCFVLAYLLTWTVFITTGLAGWRIRRAVWVGLLAVTIVPLVSLVHSSFRPAEGVIVEDTVARLGPGYAYDPAFEQPLHKATEFLWKETRQGWVRAQLPGDAEGWLRQSACMKVGEP